MKKVLSLAFIAAVLLLGCSADGFFVQGPNDQYGNPTYITDWGKVCKIPDGSGSFICRDVDWEKECSTTLGGKLVMRSECPD